MEKRHPLYWLFLLLMLLILAGSVYLMVYAAESATMLPDGPSIRITTWIGHG